MKIPLKIYVIPLASGLIGMLAIVLLSKGFDWLMLNDKKPFNPAILWIPWLSATVIAANIGFREGARSRQKTTKAKPFVTDNEVSCLV